MPQNNDLKDAIKSADVASSGLTIVISVALGFGLGFWLDKKFGTAPKLTLIFFAIGCAAGIYSVIKLAGKLKNGNK